MLLHLLTSQFCACLRPPPTQPYHSLLRQQMPQYPPIFIVKKNSKLPLYAHSGDKVTDKE